MNVYLDHAATTPIDPEVVSAVLSAMGETWGNPSSLHGAGRRARRVVEEARERVARAIGAEPQEIVFTSGATEADNHALRAVMGARPRAHLITSSVEHAAVLSTAKLLETRGHPVTYLSPDDRGVIALEAVRGTLRPDTALVALMLVNNETGVLTDIPAIGKVVHEAGALLFCDVVQAFGTLPVDVRSLGADMISLSGHKVYGPKGVGVLWVRAGLELSPLLVGGEQERGLRAGTLNVPAIVGMGAAAGLVGERLERDSKEIEAGRDWLQKRLLEVGGVRVNGGDAPRGPKHLNLTVDGVDGDALLMGLDGAGVWVSAGSACAAGTPQPSHVLLAMGLSETQARASLRFSLGRGVTREALSYTADHFERVISRCRRYAA